VTSVVPLEGADFSFALHVIGEVRKVENIKEAVKASSDVSGICSGVLGESNPMGAHWLSGYILLKQKYTKEEQEEMIVLAHSTGILIESMSFSGFHQFKSIVMVSVDGPDRISNVVSHIRRMFWGARYCPVRKPVIQARQ